jgi:hypothetical protein
MIVYTTGTINQPDAGSVGQAMIERLRDDLVAHVAWELVEEYQPASSQVRWYVFRCLAAESGLPNDFFVVVGRTLSNGELRFTICETYTQATHTMAKFPSTISSSSQYDADGSKPETYVLSTTNLVTNAPSYTKWTPSGTSTKWWITAAEDGFTVAFNGPSNGFVHVGAFIPLTQMPWPMPIQIIGADSNSDGYLTRNPAAANTTYSYYALRIEGGQSTPAGGFGPALGFRGNLQYNDKLQNNQRSVAEQGINTQVWPGQSDYRQLYGDFVGKQKRMRLAASATPVGFAFGDAYSLNGRLWVPYKPDDSRMWDTGVAAS